MDERRFTQKLLESEQILYRISCGLLRSEADRKDAMQETALKAWQYIDRLRDEESFKAWITRILINECRMIWRKNAREIPMSTFPDIPSLEQDDPELRMLLETLPENQRIPIVLHYLEGFSLREIAAVQHTSLSMVKYRMAQARKALRVSLEGKEADGK